VGFWAQDRWDRAQKPRDLTGGAPSGPTARARASSTEGHGAQVGGDAQDIAQADAMRHQGVGVAGGAPGQGEFRVGGAHEELGLGQDPEAHVIGRLTRARGCKASD